MAQITRLNSNDTRNGWIYKEINSRMDKIEKEMINLRSVLDVANSEINITLNDYININKELSNKPNNEYVEKHFKNHDIHVDETQKNIWNNKLDLRDVKNIELIKDGDKITDIVFNMKDNNKKFSIPVKND